MPALIHRDGPSPLLEVLDLSGTGFKNGKGMKRTRPSPASGPLHSPPRHLYRHLTSTKNIRLLIFEHVRVPAPKIYDAMRAALPYVKPAD
jgi:hypothetical protein